MTGFETLAMGLLIIASMSAGFMAGVLYAEDKQSKKKA